MSKPLVALLSRDTRLICDLPALGKNCFRFAVCEAIDEVEELLTRSRAAVFIADFRSARITEGVDANWLSSLGQRFEEMAIVTLTGAESPALFGDAVSIARLHCVDKDRTVTKVLGYLKRRRRNSPPAPPASA